MVASRRARPHSRAERSFLLSLEPPSRRPSPLAPIPLTVSPRLSVVLSFRAIHSSARHLHKNNRAAMLSALTAPSPARSRCALCFAR
jgi:hypothetical protein